jgi:hypothetical protein
VEEHLLGCAGCREDFALEQRIRAGMSVDGPLEFMPATSLNRLRNMLDRDSAAGADAEVFHPGTGTGTGARQPRRWQWLAAASFVGAITVAGLLTAGHWRVGSSADAPVYRTVTDPLPRAREEVVRAVFVPTITLVELQALLDEAQLRIISGPTEAGVYSLAAKSSMPTSTSLALLRRHATVRFAEIVEPAAEPSSAP